VCLRFFRRSRIVPGLTLNLSKSGGSLPLGARGARFTVDGSRGSRATVDLPGTGLHCTAAVGDRPRRGNRSTPPPPSPEQRLTPGFIDRLLTPPEERHFVDGLRAAVQGNETVAIGQFRQAGGLPDSEFPAGMLEPMQETGGLRVVLVADIHGHASRLRELPEADLLLVGGDVSNFGKPADVVRTLDEAQIRFPLVRAVLGNCDPPAAGPLIAKRGWDLHHNVFRYEPTEASTGPARRGACLFFGLAGSNQTPAFTPYEWDDAACLIESDPVVEAVAADGVAAAVHRVLVSHAPPLGSGADEVPGGRHVGSRCVAEIARRLDVQLVVCGHIHEARGIFAWEGRTVVNPGPLRDGFFATAILPPCPGTGPRITLRRLG